MMCVKNCLLIKTNDFVSTELIPKINTTFALDKKNQY